MTLLTATQAQMLNSISSSDLAASSKRQYQKALTNFWATGGQLADTAALSAYARGLPASSRGFLKAAIRRIAMGMSHQARATVMPDPVSVAKTQAKIWRLEAIQECVKSESEKGQKAHVWLSQKQVKELFNACGNGVAGQRDRIIIGLLVAAGLRRSEAAALKFSDIKMQPVGEKIRMVLQIKGKGDKTRVVPVSDQFSDALDKWRARCGGKGYVARSLSVSDTIGESISPAGIFNLVRKVGERIGRPELAPHDLRRSYAQIGYASGVPLTQVSKLLGHENLATTQKYLNLSLDLETSISDFIPFE